MMNRIKTQSTIVLAFALLSAQGFSAEETARSTWEREAELGYVSTSGNTDTETLTAKLKIINDRRHLKHTVIAEATRAESDAVITAERYFFSGKSDYKISDKDYIFGLLNYEDDRFSGYNYQTSLILGYGHKLVNTDEVKLEAEIGAGTRHNEFDTGVKTDEGILYGAMNLDWKISDSANFTEKLTVEAGDDATTTKSVSGLKAKISDNMASKITYTVKHVSDVPVGVEKTDKEIAITLVYNF